MENKEFYFNKAQQKAYLIDAPYAMHVLGRGTGKTEGILAPRVVRRVIEMPRSTRLLIAATFQQILTRTLPPLVAGWQRMGYKLGEHILIGEKPSKAWISKWNWQGPYRMPFDWKHVITWWNGSIQLMISQDRIGSSNGTSVDGIDGDEAKLLNGERLRSETFPANRGPIKAFEGNPHHHGWTFTTDMPVGMSGKWIMDLAKECDDDKVLDLLKIEMTIIELAKSNTQTAQRQIIKLKEMAKKLRTEMLYFQTGSSLINIDALGVAYVRRMMRDLTDHEMKYYILNMIPKLVENCFYADYNEDKHGYFAYDYSTFENTGYNFELLKKKDNVQVDADYDADLPLHIGLDYNKRITPIVTAQVSDGVIRLINGQHELQPKKLKDTLKTWCDYYKTHKCRTVYYWFDHTTTNEYAHTTSTQSQEVIDYLTKNCWNVEARYIGLASGHERRYTMYAHLFTEDGHYPYIFRLNRERCRYLSLSMSNTQTKLTKKGFEKDKSTELKKNYPAEESTHYGEGLDMMIWGILESGHSFIQIASKSSKIIFLGGR